MNSFPNTELNSTIPFVELLKSANSYDKINPFVGQCIDVNSYISFYAKNFESESVNDLSSHFERKFTSADV